MRSLKRCNECSRSDCLLLRAEEDVRAKLGRGWTANEGFATKLAVLDSDGSRLSLVAAGAPSHLLHIASAKLACSAPSPLDSRYIESPKLQQHSKKNRDAPRPY